MFAHDEMENGVLRGTPGVAPSSWDGRACGGGSGRAPVRRPNSSGCDAVQGDGLAHPPRRHGGGLAAASARGSLGHRLGAASLDASYEHLARTLRLIARASSTGPQL